MMQENIVVPYAIRHLGVKQIMIFKKKKIEFGNTNEKYENYAKLKKYLAMNAD